MRILGLDVGEKRIGIARADSSTRIAVPLGVVEVNGSEWLEIARIARVQGTTFFVVGLPRSNEGNETAQSAYVRKFARTLAEKIPEARIRFQDESLTSIEAEERLKKRKKPYTRGQIDSEAAAIILQDFLENLENTEVETKKSGNKAGATTSTGVSAMPTKKAKSKNKQAKGKMKTATRWITGVAIILILGLIGTGGALWYRDKVRADREEEYRRQEEAMEADVFNFTIRPGETIFDIRDNLVAVGYDITEVEEALNADYDFAFLAERPEGATLEGYLYGETHEFYRSDSAKTVLTQFLTGMGEIIEQNQLEERFAERGLSLYEGITLASVVQKEAASADQSTVAQVFLSRLSSGIPLGSDVTISYALDKIDPDRQTYTDNQAALTVDSCYNTRIYGGLPCGPISNPGLSALLAVADPSDTAYLYFLTGDDGMMYYSYTESEHIQNIYDHCQELCNVSL